MTKEKKLCLTIHPEFAVVSIAKIPGFVLSWGRGSTKAMVQEG
jgi:hypothetical protein